MAERIKRNSVNIKEMLQKLFCCHVIIRHLLTLLIILFFCDNTHMLPYRACICVFRNGDGNVLDVSIAFGSHWLIPCGLIMFISLLHPQGKL